MYTIKLLRKKAWALENLTSAGWSILCILNTYIYSYFQFSNIKIQYTTYVSPTKSIDNLNNIIRYYYYTKKPMIFFYPSFFYKCIYGLNLFKPYNLAAMDGQYNNNTKHIIIPTFIHTIFELYKPNSKKSLFSICLHFWLICLYYFTLLC